MNKKSREKHIVKRREGQKIYNEKNKEALAEKKKIYLDKNKEIIREKGKIYSAKNSEKIKIRHKAYTRTLNGFIIHALHRCKTKDKKKKIVCDLDEEYLNILLMLQDNKCYYCNHELETECDEMSLSQASPDSLCSEKGHIKGNVVWSCLFCNLAKSTNSEETFRLFLDVLFDKEDIDIDDYENIYNFALDLHSSCRKTDIKKLGEEIRDTVITKKEIEEMIMDQDNKCAITGLPLISTKINRFPFKPSVDRLNNIIHHTKDNCQIVCLAIQYGKLTFSNEAIKNYIAELKEINKI